MQESIVFNQGRPLDFEDVRFQIARIPEVMLRLRQAQRIWEASGASQSISFYETLMSEDNHFFSSRALRSLLTAIVQVGLYDRLIKHSKPVPFLVGNIRNDSALNIISKKITFEELILNSRACQLSNEVKTSNLLQGQEFAQFKAYQFIDDSYIAIGPESESLESILSWVAENKSVRRFITVGPGSIERSFEKGLLSEVSFVESIDKDPLLGWFWQSVKSLPVTA